MKLHILPLLLASLLPPVASAQAHPATQEVSLGTSALTYNSFLRPSAPFLMLEAAYHRRAASEGPWNALRLGVGVRSGLPANATFFPLEGFLQAQLTARFGIWEASMGPEIGLSGFARLDYSNRGFPTQDLPNLEDTRISPLYVALDAAPLRFHFGRFLVSALELQVGTTAPSFGAVARVQLGLLRIGASL
ncbi:hypothetical protein JRI60_19400 [Archangium violaceum]|uniref:hypothetical protein n=1 Tax=Archangium violaceum TaxID=83451 RepID=UPI0019504BDB|nr:hypothetical protein [Archangium violaceum]QRO01043.1 hypothetical protein JRI60_19400 [Archangium violaceum]